MAELKVFLSWSGEDESPSKMLAQALSEWLRVVLQASRPFFSPNIGYGGRWLSELTNELGDATYGITLLTRDNQTRPWMLFEAGAIAGHANKKSVVPVCIGFPCEELIEPWHQFQAMSTDKHHFLELVKQLNGSLEAGTMLSPETLQASFEAHWPRLASTVEECLHRAEASPAKTHPPSPLELVVSGLAGEVHSLADEIRQLDELVRRPHYAPKPPGFPGISYELESPPPIFTFSPSGDSYFINEGTATRIVRAPGFR